MRWHTSKILTTSAGSSSRERNEHLPLVHLPRQFRRLCVAVVVFALIAAALPVAAQDPAAAMPALLSDEDPLVQDARVYAADQGIELREAVRRLGLQRVVGELEAELATRERATFAGLWIEHAPRFRVVVQLTDGDGGRLRRNLGDGPLADLIEMRRARAPLAALEAAQATALRVVDALGVLAESDIDVVANRVEVYVTDRTRLDAALQQAGIDLPDTVEVVTVAALGTAEANIYAGLALTTCTSGFSVVHRPTGRRGITTAGHCQSAQAYRNTMLPYQGQRWSGSHDVQWHTASGLTVQPWASDMSTDTTPYYRVITGSLTRELQPLGGLVCKYGKATRYTCGYITSKNFRPGSDDVPNPNATFIRVHRNGVNLSSDGDSGGPWYSGSIAYGIHSGGIGDDAYYMAINYIADLGLVVLTP